MALGTSAPTSTTVASTAVAPTLASSLWSAGLPSLLPEVPAPPAVGSHPPQAGGLSLSLSAAPVPAKLVTRIQSGQFVEMRDLLGDNVALSQHFEAVHSSLPAATLLPLSTRPRLREVSSLQSWIYCFLTYIAVRTSDQTTRDWLVYARLMVRQASLHGGQGWLDYDRLFRQQAALDPTLSWNSLHPSLMASTILNQRAAGGSFCTVCQGFDHTAAQCALAYLRHPTRQDPSTSRAPPLRQQGSQQPVCWSWNDGQCCFHPNPCFRLHQCATCGSTSHRARDCRDTPPDSRFKQPRRGRIVGGVPSSSS